MKKWFATCLVIWWIGFLIVCPSAAENLTAPSLTNNPRLDVIVTNKRPLLTFYNASGGTGQKTYIIQIDKSPTFDSSSLVEYNNVPETNEVITSKRIDKQDALQDKTKYYWRVRAVDEAGDQGPWAKSRFTLDTTSDDAFMNLVRIPIKKVEVSSGEVPEYIIDITDHGQATFWRAAPPGDPVQWVRLDLGKVIQIKRISFFQFQLKMQVKIRKLMRQKFQLNNIVSGWKNLSKQYIPHIVKLQILNKYLIL